ncbi:hypothetical protein GOV14_05925 [Candidatus Pacearchaeota archaeon]|nr:hypothetical protein [Candidatus Pacearchaeota archaeon]
MNKKVSKKTQNKKKVTVLNSITENPWILATVTLSLIVVAFLVLIVMLENKKECTATGDITKTQAGERVLSLLNSQDAAVAVELSSVDEFGGSLYQANILIEGQEFPVFITKDGTNIIPPNAIIPYDDSLLDDGAASASLSAGVNDDFEADTAAPVTGDGNIDDFVTCLADAGFLIYGANWCGYTKQLVESFGGFDVVAPIYVECTEQSEVCNNQGITGYPTIKINGIQFGGGRSFASFAQATECSAPSQEDTITQAEASCN